MNATDVIGDVKHVMGSLATGDYLGAWRSAIELQNSALTIIRGLLDGTAHPAVGCPEFKQALSELRTRTQVVEARARATPDVPGGLDPAAILLIIQSVTQLLQLIHDWRRPAGTLISV